MLKLEFFDGTKTYMFPNGEVATPQVMLDKFPALEHFTHVLEINGDVCQAVMNFNAMKNMYNIDENLSDAEALAALESIINQPVPTASSPNSEERIAAALEFQNLLTLPDEEVI